MRIGFIGLGNMGGPMCRNLIKGVNHEVVVHDLDPQAVAACTSLGAAAAGDLAELAATCEVIFTSLPTPRHVEQVVAGIAAAARPGTVVLDLSTNSPAVVQRLSQGLSEKGVTLLDSPVTGGVARAEDASIVVMVGGDQAAYEAQLGLLQAFSGTQVHVGPVGSASVAKLMNNMLALCNAAVAAEGLAIAAAAGIDLAKLVEIIRNGSGNSAAFQGIANFALKGNFKPRFALDLAYKDLGLAVDLAAEHGVPGLVAPQVLNLMRMGRAMGMGAEDFGSVLQVYEKLLGREVRITEEPSAGPVP